jgi:hypothetical protein
MAEGRGFRAGWWLADGCVRRFWGSPERAAVTSRLQVRTAAGGRAVAVVSAIICGSTTTSGNVKRLANSHSRDTSRRLVTARIPQLNFHQSARAGMLFAEPVRATALLQPAYRGAIFHRRQHRGRHVEDAQKIGVPVVPLDVVEKGTRRVGCVRRVNLAAGQEEGSLETCDCVSLPTKATGGTE